MADALSNKNVDIDFFELKSYNITVDDAFSTTLAEPIASREWFSARLAYNAVDVGSAPTLTTSRLSAGFP